MFTEKNVKDAAIFFAKAVQCVTSADIPARYEKPKIPGHPDLMAFSCSMVFTGIDMPNAAGAIGLLDRELSFLKEWRHVADEVDARDPLVPESEIDARKTAEKIRGKALATPSGLERPAGRILVDEINRRIRERAPEVWLVCLVTSDGKSLTLMLYSMITARDISRDDAEEIRRARDMKKAARGASRVSSAALLSPAAGREEKFTVPLIRKTCGTAGEVMGAIRDILLDAFPGMNVENAMEMAKLSSDGISAIKRRTRAKNSPDSGALREIAVFAQSAGLRSFESRVSRLNFPLDKIMSTHDPGRESSLPKIPMDKGISVFAPAGGKIVIPVKLKLSDETESAILSMFPDSPYIRELVESRRKLKKREGSAPAIVIRFVTEVEPDN